MTNNFWQNRNDNKPEWIKHKPSVNSPDSPQQTMPDDKPWPQETADQQSAPELISLAMDAENQAEHAFAAAQKAMTAAKAADSILKKNFTPDDERIHKAKIDAANQALRASDAAINTQKSARDSAAGAVSQAEAAVEKLLKDLKNTEKEFENLENIAQASDRLAEEASEIAHISQQKAEQINQKQKADTAAYLAGKHLKEQLNQKYLAAQKELAAARELAQEANLKLSAMQQQNLRTKEETTLILSELGKEKPFMSPPERKIEQKTEQLKEQQTPTPSKVTEKKPLVSASNFIIECPPTNDLSPQNEPATPTEEIKPFSAQTKETTTFRPQAITSEPPTDLPKYAREEDLRKAHPPKSTARSILTVIVLIAIAFAVAFTIKTFVIDMTLVRGHSMTPTLQDGDRLFTGKINYFISDPQRGDIVIIDAPDYNNKYYIKRIVGMPNEQISIKNGKIYVNGEELIEPYLNGINTFGEINMIIDSSSYFVVGDNRNESHDSRDSSVGTIDKSHIRGKALFRVYPFDSFGSLYN
ncbi:MAG: signal peptidase I [Bacillota bacterium]